MYNNLHLHICESNWPQFQGTIEIQYGKDYKLDVTVLAMFLLDFIGFTVLKYKQLI